jgi:hypothetical protein
MYYTSCVGLYTAQTFRLPVVVTAFDQTYQRVKTIIRYNYKMAFDEALLSKHTKAAQTYLRKKDYGNYWYSLNKISALLGGADGEDVDDEILNKVNQSLGGPGA